MGFFTNAEQEVLAKVGPGTPSGEVFRRYWLPVEVSANLGGRPGPLSFEGARNPLRIKVLGEDLVLFRDGSGKPGLVAEHCSHRGTSLYYGRVEDDCIRCLYHGWAYDRDGNLVDTPAEPPDSNFKYTVKHPAYPCVEVAGLIFAYLGPKEKQPAFPRYDQLFLEDGVDGTRVTGNGGYIQQCNVFLTTLDNTLDHWHNEIGHRWFRGKSVMAELHHGKDGQPPSPIKWEPTPWGTRMVTLKDTETPGVYEYHETHLVFPTQRCNFPGGASMKWAVPVDDHSTRWFTVDFYPFVNGKTSPAALRALASPGPNISHTENLPRDWWHQVGQWWNLGHPWRQGTLWEDEVYQGTASIPEQNNFPDWEGWHLATSDRCVLLNHTVWREQVERVRQGLDPIGVVRDPSDDALLHIPADEFHVVGWEEGMRLFNMTVEERWQESTRPRELAAAPH